jgi:uncharacterized protein (TIRG00374 family)
MEQVHSKHVNNIVLVIIIAIIMYIVFLFTGDISKVKLVVNEIPLNIYLFSLLCAFCGYVIRTIKWNYSLQQIGAEVPIMRSAEIFFIGTAFAISPGKLGELIKSFYLKKHFNIDFSRTVPIIFADHLTTLFAWLLFIGFTIHTFVESSRIYVLFFGIIIIVVLIIKNRKTTLCIINFMTRFKFSSKYRESLLELYDSTYTLLKFKQLFISISLSLASSFTECFPLYLLLKSIGNSISIEESIFIIALSTIAGTISLIPGGLGVLEGSVIGLLIFVGVDPSLAISISLIERLIVLWFGVSIGLVILLIARQRYLNIKI